MRHFKFHASLVLLLISGCQTIGNWKPDDSKYKGTATVSDGSKYQVTLLDYLLYETKIADFRDSKYNGLGAYTSANGDKFEGEFKDGILNGKGTQSFANGNKFDGEFKNGKLNGK